MKTDTLPLELYKNNTELQLRITRMLQEDAHRWLESTQASNTERMKAFNAELEKLSGSDNTHLFTTMPIGLFWAMCQCNINDSHAIHQLLINNQAVFTAEMQKAVENWQNAVNNSIGAGGFTDTALKAFKLLGWGNAWSASENESND